MRPVALIVTETDVMGLYANGMIGRANWQPSAAWVCTGAVMLNDLGEVVHRYRLQEVIGGGIIWTHRDGRQRVHLTDLDHGTDRIWIKPGHEVRPT